MKIKIATLPAYFNVQTVEDIHRILDTFSYMSETMSCGMVYSQDISKHINNKSSYINGMIRVEFIVKLRTEDDHFNISGIYNFKPDKIYPSYMSPSDDYLFVLNKKILPHYASRNH